MVKPTWMPPKPVRAPAPGRHRLRSRLILALVAGLCSLALGEFLMRLWVRPLYVQPEQLEFWSFDDRLGWKHRPGQHGEFRTGQFAVDVAINSRGLRDDEHAHERDPGRRRILVLGDSFAWGFGVEAKERFSERLEAVWPGVEVVNAGVSGYGSDQELLYLEQEGVRYRPDLVVCVFTGNDLQENLEQQVYVVYQKPRFMLANGHLECQNLPLSSPARRALLNRWLMRKSSLFRAAQLLWLHLTTKRSPRDRQFFIELGKRGKESTTLTRALLERMQKAALEIGAEFLVVTNDTWWPGWCGSYDGFVEALRGSGLHVLQQEECPGYSPESMIIHDDGHWNALGHQCIADGIRATVERLALLPSIAPGKSGR